MATRADLGAGAFAAGNGDMIMTLGAGSVSQLGAMILKKLEEKESATAAPPLTGGSR